MINIVIVDDEKFYCDLIQSICKEFFEKQKYEYTITVYESGQSLLWDIDENRKYDIYLIDIEIPDINGMEIAKRIRKHDMAAYIIFITCHLGYCIEGYKYRAWRYVTKDAVNDELPAALADLCENMGNRELKQYVIKKRDAVEKVAHQDILYLCKVGKETIIHTGVRDYPVRKPLKQVIEEMQDSAMLMTDRSYAVNIHNVAKISGHSLIMRDNKELPISIPKYKLVRKAIMDYWGDKI